MEKEELAKRYDIDFKKLEQEQIKLSKTLEIKDKIDLKSIDKIGAIENLIIKNKIISTIVVVDKDNEIIEQAYFLDKLRFPYIYGFESYRLLQPMTGALAKITEKPDIVLIKGSGINHIRLGVASHFSLVTGLPSIGIDDKLIEGNELKKDELFIDDEKVGMRLVTKKGSRPLYISPGNAVSVKRSYDFIKNLVIFPHKMPEPIHIAHRYAKEVKKELKID